MGPLSTLCVLERGVCVFRVRCVGLVGKGGYFLEVLKNGLPLNISSASLCVQVDGWLLLSSNSKKSSIRTNRTRMDFDMMTKYAISHVKLSMFRNASATIVPGSFFPHRFTLIALKFCGLLGL